MTPRPLRDILAEADGVQHYRGEDLLTYAYMAYTAVWFRWDGPGAIWRRLSGGPDVPVYRLSHEEAFPVLRAQTVDLDIRMGWRDRDGKLILA